MVENACRPPAERGITVPVIKRAKIPVCREFRRKGKSHKVMIL